MSTTGKRCGERRRDLEHGADRRPRRQRAASRRPGSPGRRRAGRRTGRRARRGRPRRRRTPRRSRREVATSGKPPMRYGISAARLPEPAKAAGDPLDAGVAPGPCSSRASAGSRRRRRSSNDAVTAARAPRRGPCRPRPEQQTTSSLRSRPAGSAKCSAWAVSSAGMMPSSRVTRAERRERVVVGDGHVPRAAGVAQPGVLGPGAGVVEARPRSSAPRGSGPRRPARIADSEPCRTPGRPPTVSGAPWRPVSRPSPAASTPTSSTPGSSTKPANMPIEFEPPPTQAITRSGRRPVALEQLRPAPRRRSRAAGRGRSPDTAPGRRPSR